MLSRILYPALRTCRNLLLKVMGRTKINNLRVTGNERFYCKDPKIKAVAANCGTHIAHLGFNRTDHLRPLRLIVRFDYISRRRAACENCPREDYQHQGANPEARRSIGVPSDPVAAAATRTRFRSFKVNHRRSPVRIGPNRPPGLVAYHRSPDRHYSKCPAHGLWRPASDRASMHRCLDLTTSSARPHLLG